MWTMEGTGECARPDLSTRSPQIMVPQDVHKWRFHISIYEPSCEVYGGAQTGLPVSVGNSEAQVRHSRWFRISSAIAIAIAIAICRHSHSHLSPYPALRCAHSCCLPFVVLCFFIYIFCSFPPLSPSSFIASSCSPILTIFKWAGCVAGACFDLSNRCRYIDNMSIRVWVLNATVILLHTVRPGSVLRWNEGVEFARSFFFLFHSRIWSWKDRSCARTEEVNQFAKGRDGWAMMMDGGLG